MSKGKSAARKIAVLAIFTALSLIMFLIENLFPPLFLPGAKMGLSNIFSIAALIAFSPVEGFAVVCVRTLLGAVLTGNPSAVLYSFTGGMVSMAISSVALYTLYPKISVMAVSILAAVAHNVTQNIVYVLVTETPLMFSYMPYLALIGILSGAIVGGAVMLLFKRVPLSVYEKLVGGIEERAKSGGKSGRNACAEAVSAPQEGLTDTAAPKESLSDKRSDGEGCAETNN